MRLFYFIAILLIPSFVSCSTNPKLILRPEDRPYRPCTEKELERHLPDHNNKIAFCFRYCVKYKFWKKHIPENCKEWKIDILDKQSDIRRLRPRNFLW